MVVALLISWLSRHELLSGAKSDSPDASVLSYADVVPTMREEEVGHE